MADIFLSFLWYAACIAAYTTIGGGVWKLTGELLMERKNYLNGDWDKTHPVPVLAGAFWPIGLPIAFPFLLYALSKRTNFSLPALSKKKNAEQKVLDYAASPVLVLSQIVASRITREPENLKVSEIGRYSHRWFWRSSDGRIEVSSNLFGTNGGVPDNIDVVRIDGIVQSCVPKEIVDALKRAYDFNLKKALERANADRQLKALSAVESLLLPEKE